MWWKKREFAAPGLKMRRADAVLYVVDGTLADRALPAELGGVATQCLGGGGGQ